MPEPLRRSKRAATTSMLVRQASSVAEACRSDTISRKGAPMKIALAPLRIVEPDPQDLECSILYFKEKLEYAVESFAGSAAYNQNQNRRACSAIMALGVITTLFIFIGTVYHTSRNFWVFPTVAVSASLIAVILGSWMRYRDYHSSCLAHAHASMKLKRIESRVIAAENDLGISAEELEEFYGEYRTVYDDTNAILHASWVS